MTLFTNSSAKRDFVENAVTDLGRNCSVQIASAFFSNYEVVKGLVERGCSVMLVVRLGAGTDPQALTEVLRLRDVQVRYFVDRGFHPKLFIFGGAAALVGSANLTKPGMRTNAEISVVLPSDDPRFDELVQVFSHYWDEAKALGDPAKDPTLDKFRRAIKETNSKPDSLVDTEVERVLGKHAFANIERGAVRQPVSTAFVDGFRRRHQAFLAAFKEVRDLYESTGKRLVTERELPLRIEVDQFFNWLVVESEGVDESKAPVRRGEDRRAHVIDEIRRFQQSGWDASAPIVREKYPTIARVLGSKQALTKVTRNELYEALLVVHAFRERMRWHEGGAATMKARFHEVNEHDRVVSTLSHLLFDGGDYVKRIADCIYDRAYQLSNFGESCVQETFGWVNSEDVPIFNGRVQKALRLLGFEVVAGV